MQRLYVLVRSDLSVGQQAVQAGHAVAEWCHTENCRYHWNGRAVVTPEPRWQNGVLIYLSVQNEKELKKWAEKFSGRAVVWVEPDWNNQMTAIAVLGERKEFVDLSLL